MGVIINIKQVLQQRLAQGKRRDCPLDDSDGLNKNGYVQCRHGDDDDRDDDNNSNNKHSNSTMN